MKATTIYPRLVLALALLTMLMPGHSQNRNLPDHNQAIGLSLGCVTSADGYGLRYSPMLFFKHKRTVLFAGFLIQKDRGNFSGVQLKLDYALTGCSTPEWGVKGSDDYACNSKLELVTFVTAAYNKDAYLGPAVLREERGGLVESNQPVSAYKFRSVEAFGGFGLRWRLFKGVKWVNSLGVGGNYSLNYPGKLFYNKISVGLMLKTEVIVRLNL